MERQFEEGEIWKDLGSLFTERLIMINVTWDKRTGKRGVELKGIFCPSSREP